MGSVRYGGPVWPTRSEAARLRFEHEAETGYDPRKPGIRMQITIEPTGKGKGRAFQAELLGWINAPTLFGGGGTGNNHRPAWISYAASEQGSKMFSANFLRGKVAKGVTRHNNQKFQLLRAAGYQHHTRKVGGGVVTTAYIPDLFRIDPGMIDPEQIRFVLLTAKDWRASQQLDLEAALRFCLEKEILFKTGDSRSPLRSLSESEVALMMPEAMLFLMYLDRRSRYPMPAHPHFGLQVMVSCLNAGLAQRHSDAYGRGARLKYEEHGLREVGLPPGLAFKAQHDSFGELLAEEVRKWHA